MQNTQINYEELTKQLIEEHNKVRADPSSYIPKLENHIKYFRGDVLARPGSHAIKTHEGKAAYEEAIEFLKRQMPVGLLTHDSRLSSACKDLVDDLGPKGQASHESADGKTASDRIEAYCEWDGTCCENLDFGARTAEDIIVNFIVDDGVPDRGDRKNLFKPDINYIGVAVGPHKEYEVMAVVDYVAGVRNIGEESADIKSFIPKYIEKTMNKENKPKNAFQEDDPDAPDETVSVQIVKTTKVIKGKARKVTKKIYTLKNKTQHVVEIQDV
jgi:uncharacterized protein YkwD